MADTTPTGDLVTAQPARTTREHLARRMEFGAAEIALAATKLGHNAVPSVGTPQLGPPTTSGRHRDTFTCTNTSALAHADLISDRRRRHPSGLPSPRTTVAPSPPAHTARPAVVGHLREPARSTTTSTPTRTTSA